MGLPRPPGLPAFSTFKSWFVKVVNSRFGKVDQAGQNVTQPHPQSVRTLRPFSSSATHPTAHIRSQTLRPLHLHQTQARGIHQFHIPRFSKPFPSFPRIKFQPTTYFLRPQVGAFPRSPWGSPLGATARFHTSPASTAVALNHIAHSVSAALRSGLHPATRLAQPIQGQIIAQVAARAACQTTDGPAGYIRFTLSPPAWTPTDTDLSDPDIVKAIDTQIAELQRVKNAILKLKQYGDFPVRTVLPSNPEARIDVLFRGATAEDVARWNKNEFKLTSGRVGADQVFCAGRFEEYVRWSEVLDAEKKVEKEMEKANSKDGGLLKFWEELNLMEGRIR